MLSLGLVLGAVLSLTHVVQPGDTLGQLAHRYGTTVPQLAQTNQIDNVDLIHVGQVLAVPVTSGVQPQPQSVVPQQQGRVTREGLYSALQASSWPRYTWEHVIRIAWCESKYNTRAVGRAGERGLMQVHPVHRDLWQRFDLFSVHGNLEAAYIIWVRAGYSFTPWSCK